MARKRNIGSDSIVSASPAPARTKRVTTRGKHTATAAAAQVAEQIEPTPVAATPEVSPVTQPTHEEIAALAYSYWEGRGHPTGSGEEDWLRAERELLNRRALIA
jgi:hypothetical protein